MAMVSKALSSVLIIGRSGVFTRPFVLKRHVRHRAFEALFDQDALAEARAWRSSFTESSLPKGQTSYSRSSGPGGQHVNKTETKATTTWQLDDLTKVLPKVMHSGLRSSRYYASRNNCISIQAQSQRSRTANTDENHRKLVEEVHRIYLESVPGVTSDQKARKYEALEKSFHNNRVTAKKQHSSKKAARKGSLD